MPIMEPHFRQRFGEYAREKGTFREEDLVLPRLPHEFPSHWKLVSWAKFGMLFLLTSFLARYALSPWFELFVMGELIYA